MTAGVEKVIVPTKKGTLIRMEDHLKSRLMHQCERLQVSQNALIKQAIVKFLEEEEKIEAINAKR